MSTITGKKLQQSDLASGLTLVGCELAGLRLNGVQLTLGDGNKIHGCTFTGASRLGFVPGAKNNQITWNDFTPTITGVIGGWIGSGTIVEHNKVDLRQIPQGTGDNAGAEFCHLVGAADGVSVSYNVMIGNLVRWLIELQEGMINLKFAGNWGRLLKGGSAYSLAIGGLAKSPYANAGQNVNVSGNVALCDYIAGMNTALEIGGDKNIVVATNWFGGFQYAITNGTGGQNNQPLVTRDNDLIYTKAAYADGDGAPWPVPPRQSNDRLFKLGDPIAPAAPAMPTNVGAAFDPAGNSPATDSSSAGGATPVAQADLIASITSTTNSITVTLKTAPSINSSAPTYIAYKSLKGTEAFETFLVLAGSTIAEIYNLSPSWQYTLKVIGPAGEQDASAQCQLTGDTSGKAPDGTPATPAPVATPPAEDTDQLWVNVETAYQALKARLGK